ncbi:aminoacyl-tRNA hydrolase [Parashewanella curva]|uniref:Aminoacyl-tRNA hydrolase n=1 Tax=Parashewanella curva TaxID=2338552 RepID=A0A3L8PZ45_9GAMM|nr:alternative ribosome rescue aminoacyl-tRNA hydrolase ArfB [Parashewanella curva]RLV60575.1 aminoacyl-tRNA hydrolase [Parashewanella curva]
MIQISARVHIPESEVEWQFVRASGTGGQHVNKVSTAAVLIFDIKASSLPEYYQQRLLSKADHRITKSGKIIIKAQSTRSQDDNRQQALAMFIELVKSVTVVQKKRIATKPTRSSQTKRMDKKKQRGQTKSLRSKKIPL